LRKDHTIKPCDQTPNAIQDFLKDQPTFVPVEENKSIILLKKWLIDNEIKLLIKL